MYHSNRPEKESEIFLAFCFSSESETTEYIVTRLKEVFEEYHVPTSRLVALVTDRASNIKNVPKRLGLLGLTCGAHACHNAVEATLKSLICLIDLVKDVRSLIAQFNRSTAASSTLEAVQSENGIDPKRVISYSDNRWDSFFEACFRLLELGDEILNTIRKRKLKSGNLDNPQLRLLFVILRLLKPIKEFTDRLIHKNHPERIDIINALRAAVDLFVDTSTSVLHNIQAFWKSEGEEKNASVKLDSKLDADNVLGLSAAVSVIFLQFLHRYLFNVLLEQFSSDPSYISLQCVGASLDERWKEAIKNASNASLAATILRDGDELPTIKGFSDNFLELVVECKSLCDSKDYDIDPTDIDVSPPSSQSNSSDDDANTYKQPSTAEINNGTANQARSRQRTRNFARFAESAIAALETEAETQNNFEFSDDDTIKPLVTNFEIVDVEDMLSIFCGLYSTFVQNVNSIDSRLSDQLKRFCNHRNLYDWLQSTSTDDASTDSDSQANSDDDSDEYLGFHSWQSFDSQKLSSKTGNTSTTTERVTKEDLQEDEFWEDLRKRSQLLPRSVWLRVSAHLCDKSSLITLIHQALSTVPPSSVSIERDFSTATQLQSDLRMQLHPDMFASEVYIARNYTLIGFPKFLEVMKWNQSVGHRTEELKRRLLESSSEASSPVTLSPSLSTASTLITPTPSRRSSILTSPGDNSSTSSSNGRSSSSRTSVHRSNFTPNLASPFRPATSKTSLEGLAKVAELEQRVFASDGFSLSLQSNGRYTTDSHDLASIVVDNVRERSKKRKEQTAPAPGDSHLSNRRHTILSYLNKPEFTQITWNSMVNDDRCGLSDYKKLLADVWTFASVQKLIGQLLSKMKESIRDEEVQLDKELQKWRRDMESTVANNHSSSAPNPTAATLDQPNQSSPTTNNDLSMNDVAKQFEKLPGVRIIPARYPTLRQLLLANRIKTLPNDGQGNCFFLATSQVIAKLPVDSRKKIERLVGENLDHLRLRAIAVEHIRAHWDTYKNSRSPHGAAKRVQGKDKWLKALATEGTWADHLSVQALATELRVEFLVLRDKASEIVVGPPGVLPIDTVHLVLHGEQHYEATAPMKARK